MKSKMFYLVKILLGTIRKTKDKLGTYEIDKISLSCFVDKRYMLDDGIHTLAFFHKNSVTSCEEIKKDCDKKRRD